MSLEGRVELCPGSDSLLSPRVTRRRYSDRDRRGYVDRYWGSGLKQRDYADREGLEYTTFLGWLRRYRRESAGGVGEGVFAEYRLEGDAGNRVIEEKESGATLEVFLPDGVILRGVDPYALSNLYHALKGGR